MPPKGRKAPQKQDSGANTIVVALLLVLGCGAAWMAFGGVGRGGGAGVPLTPQQAAAKFVNDLIKQHRVIVFSKSYCPYSMRGKDAMRGAAGADSVHVVELDQLAEGQPEMALVQDELERITGARTVPRIFVAGAFIGGADDVTSKARSGELANILTKAGIPKS